MIAPLAVVGENETLGFFLLTEVDLAEPYTAEHFGAEDRSQRSTHDTADLVDRDDVERAVDFEPHAAPAGKETMCVVRASALKAAGRAALASMFNHSPKWPRCRILFYSIFIGTSPPS